LSECTYMKEMQEQTCLWHPAEVSERGGRGLVVVVMMGDCSCRSEGLISQT